MRYKLWSRISLGISIIGILITISFINIQNKKKDEYLKQLAQYEQEILAKQDSIRQLDSIRFQYMKDYYLVLSQFDQEYKTKRSHVISLYSWPNYDSIAIQQIMEMEYDSMLVRYEEEYGINQDIIRHVYQPSPFGKEISFTGVPRDKYEDPRYHYETTRERIIIQQPRKPQTDSFGILGGSASILGLFFTFFFRIKDKKNEKADKERIKHEINREPIAKTNNIIAESEFVKNRLFFGLHEEYNGYMTAITYTNCGDEEARNVSVNVEQNENETVSLTVIKNDDLFPIEMLNIGDSFEIEVECYYPKAYRYFTVEWEDSKGKHTQRNRVQLSKNYEV